MSDAFDAMVQGILNEQAEGSDPSVVIKATTTDVAAIPREKPAPKKRESTTRYKPAVEGKVSVPVGGPWKNGEAVKFPKGYVRLTLRGTWNSLCMYEDELEAVARWFAEEYPRHKAAMSEGLTPLPKRGE